MAEDEIRFTEKKVDESWKEQIAQEGKNAPQAKRGSEPSAASSAPQFGHFLSSLAMQVLIHFGEIENPMTKTKSQDLDAAKEVIDLLLVLKQKTAGNLTPEETRFFEVLLADLQVKFAQLVSGAGE